MSDSTYTLVLDQGRSHSRAVIYNARGEVVSQAEQDFQRCSPIPGWDEHDAMAIWSSQVASMEQALEAEKLPAQDIVNIRIASQLEATMLWDRATGLPVYNAIAPDDQRVATYCSQLSKQGRSPMIRQKTGRPLVPELAAIKLRWLLHNIKGVRARAEAGELCFGLTDSWLLWNLTSGQVHATDVSNASRTALYNLKHKEWDHELLKLFDIPRAVLPNIHAAGECYGVVAPGRTLSGVPITAAQAEQS